MVTIKIQCEEIAKFTYREDQALGLDMDLYTAWMNLSVQALV